MNSTTWNRILWFMYETPHELFNEVNFEIWHVHKIQQHHYLQDQWTFNQNKKQKFV
jgi:hypothetical protein